jgi:hypothetical protein
MTGNLVLDLVISLGGVAVLVAVSGMLGGWRSLKVDEAAARDRLAFDEQDFVARDLLLSRDGKAAAALSNEEAVFLFPLGDSLATRRTRLGAVRVAVEGASVIAALGDVSKAKLKLAAPDEATAARWAGRLKGEAYN